jgi:hypothetical protein
MASHPIYQFYAELCDYEPKIWRRFQVMDHITAARLGYILMTLFEMQACHLFCFDISFLENLSRRQKRTGSQSDLELLSYLKEDEERTQTHIELPCEEEDWLEFRKKSGKSYEAFREWLGVDELNLDEFDIDDMNFRLKKVPRIYTDIYEHELPPTKQSLKLLTREYKKK